MLDDPDELVVVAAVTDEVVLVSLAADVDVDDVLLALDCGSRLVRSTPFVPPLALDTDIPALQ